MSCSTLVLLHVTCTVTYIVVVLLFCCCAGSFRHNQGLELFPYKN
jgi:hypothetical protein